MLCVDVGDFLAELGDAVAGDANPTRPARAEQEGRLGVFATCERVERGGERGDFDVTMHDVGGTNLGRNTRASTNIGSASDVHRNQGKCVISDSGSDWSRAWEDLR